MRHLFWAACAVALIGLVLLAGANVAVEVAMAIIEILLELL